MTYQHLFSVAPMMDWTDKHCRYFHRLMSKNAVLYTEMVTSEAIIRGDRQHLLEFSPKEQPVILQIGGSDAEKCAVAAKIGQDYGYNEINLNVGCPSDRVQSGAFGACLMYDADLVHKITSAMVKNITIPVTVKCRLGVDNQNPADILPDFIQKMSDSGVNHVIIHARKAWLNGLSPKENRTIPPLDYDMVYEMKQKFPHLTVSINGGIDTIEQVNHHLNHVDGVMMGRTVYHNPCLLMRVDKDIYNMDTPDINDFDIIKNMMDYIDVQMTQGIKFYQIAKHILGFRHGQSGARTWRRILTEQGCKPTATPLLLEQAFMTAFSRNDT